MREDKTTHHFQAKINPYDDADLYNDVMTARGRHNRRSSADKAVLYEWWQAKKELEAMKAGKSIEAMLQQILDAVANGVPKGKARKEAVATVTNEMSGFLARLRNVAQSEDSE